MDINFKKIINTLKHQLAQCSIFDINHLCLGCLISMYLIDRIGRRSLLIISGIGMGTFHALIAWSFYTTEHIQQNPASLTYASENVTYQNLTELSHMEAKEDDIENTYLPLIGLIGFFLTFAIGTGAVPMVILGEVFPQSIKGIAVSVINSCMWLLNFGMSKTFFLMNNAIGINGTFIFFSTCSISMSLYVFLLLPETKNKTLNQIQREIESKKVVTVEV